MPPVSPVQDQRLASQRPTFVKGSSSSESSYLAHQSQPFLIIPSLDDNSDYLSTPSSALIPESNMRPKPSFPIHSPPRDTAAKSKLQERLSQSTFKAPAHKHAHHLHSIPPKEKTTRTLILDHLLWLHGRARFAQARAELGMNTPSNVEQIEDDYASDGEDVDVLGYFAKDGKHSGYQHGRRDVEMNSSTSAPIGSSSISHGQQAKGFKARADGLEKVLSAMLDQPPEELPFDPDDLLFSDTSFTPPSAPTLPNGVRLRIAIAALVNDFFAEDNLTIPPKDPGSVQAQTSGLTAYTPSLSSLARISSFAHHSDLPILPPFHTFSAAAGAGAGSTSPTSVAPPAGSIFSTIPRGAGPEGPWALGGSSAAAMSSGGHSNPARLPGGFPTYVPPSRSASSLMGQPSSSSGRSFASGFPLSMPLDLDDTPAPPPRVKRAVGRSRDLYSSGAYAYQVRAGDVPQRPRRCPRHLVIDCPPSSTCTHSSAYVSPKMSKSSRHKSSIGAGLGHPGPPLRRIKFIGSARGKEARMTDLIPRFLRLSALVAAELGWESRGDEWDALAQMDLNLRRQQEALAGVPSSLSSHLSSDSDDDSSARGKTKKTMAARPSRAWYALLSGLLTRAALQGYLVKGWKGTDAVEVLLGVGAGQNNPFTPNAPLPASLRGHSDQNRSSSALHDGDDSDDIDDDENEYEPDEMPELVEAWDILFGAKFHTQAPPGSFMARTKETVDEYDKVMALRVSEFFTISPNSGDLSLHLEELARKYPCEPVERAALRFCEAVARWRGRPELETYKPKSSSMSQPSTPGTSPPGFSQALSIHSLIHPHPQDSPKALIERYFIMPKPSDFEVEKERNSRRRDSISSNASGTKRSRRNSWADSKGKKVVITHQAWVEEDEYVGPYGI